MKKKVNEKLINMNNNEIKKKEDVRVNEERLLQGNTRKKWGECFKKK